MQKFLIALLAAMASQLALQASALAATTAAQPAAEPYPSTYVPRPSGLVLIRGATVLTGTGQRLDDTDVLVEDGRIQALGRQLTAAAGTRIIEAKGRWVTPGIIDVHSHLGVYPSPGVLAHSDGNEATSPNTANVWAEHSVWPQDPGFTTALQGGITTLQVLPGSANLFGGRSVVLKNVHSISYQGMKFPGAPQGLKMACGENPKRVYGGEGKFPSTRMGNVAGWRAQWIEAQEYAREWQDYEAKKASAQLKSDKDKDKDKDEAKPPKRDLQLETLAAVLRGEILVHHHCYRADEMVTVLDMAKEFGYKVAAFHHATEAYKIADVLANNGVCAAMWADWYGFKMESYDGIPENIALVDAVKNGCAIVHSDSEEGIQRLNQEAAKAIAVGRAAGLTIPPERAIRWLTANPARALGISERTGTLERGKMADIVIWNRDPFSSFALADQVLIDGVLQYDRLNPAATPPSDFLLGQPALNAVGGKAGAAP